MVKLNGSSTALAILVLNVFAWLSVLYVVVILEILNEQVIPRMGDRWTQTEMRNDREAVEKALRDHFGDPSIMLPEIKPSDD